MVIKDAVGSKLAQIEHAEIEKQFLLTLKSNNPNKKIIYKQVPLPGVIMAQPTPSYPQYKPQEMHCLKKLLEQDYSLYDESEIANCVNQTGYHPQAFEDAMTKYVQEEYHKYLLSKEGKALKKVVLIAQGLSTDDLSDSESDESDEEHSAEDDGPITPQVNINII